MQVWHEDNMFEPFYESGGPDYKEVRKDVKNRFYNLNGLCIVSVLPENIGLVDQIIEEIIPETRNDFGSYRGYSMSRLCYNIAVDVLRKYNAYKTIEKGLLPYIKYKLYNPDDGWVMRQASNRFNQLKRN